MFRSIIISLLLLEATVIGLGLAENYHNSLSYTLRDCTKTSENNGYIGYQCPNAHYYIPESERDQLPR